MIKIKPYNIEHTPTEKAVAVSVDFQIAPQGGNSSAVVSFFNEAGMRVASRRVLIPGTASEADVLAAIGAAKAGGKKNSTTQEEGDK